MAVLGSFKKIHSPFQFHGRGEEVWQNEKGTRSQACTSAYLKMLLSENTELKSCFIWGKHGISLPVFISNKNVTKISVFCWPVQLSTVYALILKAMLLLPTWRRNHSKPQPCNLLRERRGTKKRTWHKRELPSQSALKQGSSRAPGSTCCHSIFF